MSIYCPYCHKHTYLTILTNSRTPTGDWAMGRCNACDFVVLIHSNTGNIYPNPLPKAIDENIKENIKKDCEEANLCFSIRAYRAAVVMARRALQSICLDKGAKDDEKLEKQIDWLLSEAIITKDLKNWAHEVRMVGDNAAHPKKPEEDQSVSKDDAEDILKLLEQFCQVLYVAPAIAEVRKKLRENP